MPILSTCASPHPFSDRTALKGITKFMDPSNLHVDMSDAIGRLALSVLLGAFIGVERQWHQKMAGLRTNALVALGSCGFVCFSAMVGVGDPTRVAAQVVTGIGFLGAGVILREGINVHGLNTAATLWCSALWCVWSTAVQPRSLAVKLVTP